MGTDIHVLTEKYYENKGWFNTDSWRYNPYYDSEDEDDCEDEMELVEIFDDRDYYLFSILADVRNYLDAVTPISEPKGLPEDCHEITRTYAEGYGGHSHSYFTIKELYNNWLRWDTVEKRSGILVGQQLKDFDNKGIAPKEHFVRSFYEGKEEHAYREWTIEYNPMDRFMFALIDRFCELFFIGKRKEIDYKESEEFKKIIEKYGDEFRTVFFFDS